MLERVAADYAAKGVKVGKALCEEAMERATEFSVMYVPTTVLFKKGEPVDQFVGAISEGELRGKLNALLG